MTIERLSVHVHVTSDTLEDALAIQPMVQAHMEYAFADPPPPTPVEQLTGWRSWTASNGYEVRVRVGWRRELHEALQRVVWDLWPEPACDD